MKPFIVSLCLAVAAAVTAADARLKIAGSDLLDPALTGAIEEFAAAENIEIEVAFKGSYPAMEAIKSGAVDLAVVAIPQGGEQPAEPYQTLRLASKVVAVAVSQNNPMNQITIQQLGSVFGQGEGSVMTRWGDLGLTGEWASRAIAGRSISRERHALAVDLFRHQALGARSMKANIAESPDLASIQAALRDDAGSIAIIHRVPTDASGIKILPIASTSSDFAHSPTPETIASGDYPLTLPIHIVFSGDSPGEEVKDLLRFLLSDQAAEAIEASDLTPLPGPVRQRRIFDVERL